MIYQENPAFISIKTFGDGNYSIFENNVSTALFMPCAGSQRVLNGFIIYEVGRGYGLSELTN